MKSIIFKSLLTFTWVVLPACGGGGGGGGPDGLRRSTDTALRIIHSSLDSSPVTVRIGEEQEVAHEARFAEVTYYQRVQPGEASLVVERKNSPGTVARVIPTEFERNSEYTLFLFGDTSSGDLTFRLIQDSTERPAKGFARVTILNGLRERASISASADGAAFPPISRGSLSEERMLPSGPANFSIQTTGGMRLADLTVDLPEQGEATILVAGSTSLGAIFTPVYFDLD